MPSPEEWRKLYLIDILDGSIRNGYSPNASDIETGYYVLGLGALGDNGLNIKAVKPVKFTKEVKQSLLQVGDFLISRSNTPDKVGRSIRFKGEISNCSYPDLMMRFRIDCNKADPSFIELKLMSSTVRDYFTNCAAGSSGTMVKINKSVVEKTPLLLPSYPEQQKIAQILSTWDKAIDKLEALIAAKQKRKKALMQQLLTGKKRFSKFGQEWKQIRLKKIINEERSRNKNRVITRVLSVTNHSGFVLPKDQFSRRVASDDLSNYKIVRKSEFGYNPSRINVGSFARLDDYDHGVLSPMYIIFSINDKLLDSDFFINWMKSHEAKQKITSSTQGSVRDSVGFDALGSFLITLPPIEEQQKIALVLTTADKEITIHQKQFAALKQQKKALMQQLLTGKKRVQTELEV